MTREDDRCLREEHCICDVLYDVMIVEEEEEEGRTEDGEIEEMIRFVFIRGGMVTAERG